jgi:hypothetical protein
LSGQMRNLGVHRGPSATAFGNVLNLALRLGMPAYVAPLVAPAIDSSP